MSVAKRNRAKNTNGVEREVSCKYIKTKNTNGSYGFCLGVITFGNDVVENQEAEGHLHHPCHNRLRHQFFVPYRVVRLAKLMKCQTVDILLKLKRF